MVLTVLPSMNNVWCGCSVGPRHRFDFAKFAPATAEEQVQWTGMAQAGMHRMDMDNSWQGKAA